MNNKTVLSTRTWNNESSI